MSAKNSIADVVLHELPRHLAKDGELVVMQAGSAGIPIPIARAFTVRATKDAVRGRHAHKACTQFMICVRGQIDVLCDDGTSKANFSLQDGHSGVLLPAGIWASETYRENDSILLVLCDRPYEESDYLRNYDEFIRWRNNSSLSARQKP